MKLRHDHPDENTTRRRVGTTVKVIFVVVVLVVSVMIWWWSLGYRADNCHTPEMGRGQQWICDILTPSNSSR